MQKVYSVSQINTYIKNMFTQDFLLARVGIRGEVSNCKYHTSGHIYFSLKDADGAIACVMFAGSRKGLAFRLTDGQQVVVRGSVSVYERDGRYQMYAREITLDGAGFLYERYLALKQELEDMGMFAAEYKQPLPFYVRTLGVVTAPTGAAIRDIIQIARRRNPGIRILLYPALVQGQGAAESIAEGIKALDAAGVDAMIVGRGGGSMEDLWAFNEEIVARAVFDCRTPVISAVGHETDTTIIDYVADLRAPTPSAAAELAIVDVRALLTSLRDTKHRMDAALQERIHLLQSSLDQYRIRLLHSSPLYQLQTKQQLLLDLEDRLQKNMQLQVLQKRNQLNLYAERMKGLSPLEKLTSGFACMLDEKGRRVYSARMVEPGDLLISYVADGWIQSCVMETGHGLLYGQTEEERPAGVKTEEALTDGKDR